VPVTSPLNDPEKLVAVVAVVALPLKLAVMVPAEKLPDESRATIALAVFALVAVVAELATLPAVEIVASFESVIAADDEISALTINELDNNPAALLCTTPAVLNGVIVAVLLITSSVILINPAAKLPFASRFTIVLAVSRLVAAFASTVAAATLAADCPPTVLTIVALCVPVTSPLNDPVKLVAVVAVVALPDKVAVMVPAEKLPDESRATIALAVFALVAVVAEFATLPAVEIVANFESVIAADDEISALTINELDNNPDALLCTTPAVLNGVMVAELLITVSVILIKPAAKLPLASRFTMALAVSRLVAAFARTVAAATFAAVCPPTVLTTVALCVPVTSPLNDPVKLVEVVAVVAVVAFPDKFAVIVPAEKLPDESRATISFAVFALVAVVAEFATFPAVLMVANFESVIAAAGSISALTINELDNNPDALL
jgi:hypothetical protein